MMCGDHDGPAIVKFWTHLKTLPDYKHHQVLHNLTDDELSRTIPCSIHADGAEFHRNSEYFVTSWCSSFQTGGGPTCLVSRYPISLVSEAQIEDDEDSWICFQNLGQKTKKTETLKDSIQRVVHVSLFFAPFLDHMWFLVFLVFGPWRVLKRCSSLSSSKWSKLWFSPNGL